MKSSVTDFYRICCVLFQSFEVHLLEGDFDFHASQMEWMPQNEGEAD